MKPSRKRKIKEIKETDGRRGSRLFRRIDGQRQVRGQLHGHDDEDIDEREETQEDGRLDDRVESQEQNIDNTEEHITSVSGIS